MARHASVAAGEADPAFPAVLYDQRDGVAWVTLNRPDRLNAYNVEMRDIWSLIILSGTGFQPVLRVTLLP
jgi:hypothetical protein